MISFVSNIKNFFTSSKMIFSFATFYLITAFLTFTFITANVKSLIYLSYILAIWGAFIIFFNIFKKNNWKFSLQGLLVLLFIISFVISSAFMYQYGITENIKGLIWLSLELMILFLLNKENLNNRYLKIFLIIFVVISTLYSCLSITMAIIGYMHYPLSTVGDTAAGGMAHGRLYGMYSDPNYGAISSVLCISCLAFLLHNKKSKFNIIISSIIVFLNIIYISLSGSRSGIIVLFIFVFITSLLWLFISKKKNILISIICSILISGTTLSLCIVIEPAYEVIEPQILKVLNGPITNPIHAYTVQFADKVRAECGIVDPYITNNGTEENQNNNESTYQHGEVDSEHIGVLGRSENQDISNNRFAIWKSALELFQHSPVIGLSNRNFSDYCKQNLPNTYLSKMQWTSLHNAFLDVLISQGIIGILLWLGILLIILINLISEYRVNKNDSRYAVLIGIYFGLIAMCMFYSELIYVNTIGSVFFWYVFGHLNKNKRYIIKKKK